MFSTTLRKYPFKKIEGTKNDDGMGFQNFFLFKTNRLNFCDPRKNVFRVIYFVQYLSVG